LRSWQAERAKPITAKLTEAEISAVFFTTYSQIGRLTFGTRKPLAKDITGYMTGAELAQIVRLAYSMERADERWLGLLAQLANTF
jgi:hypothetical protein